MASYGTQTILAETARTRVEADANRSLATVLPNAEYRTLEGQTHMLKPKAPAPMLVEFFKN